MMLALLQATCLWMMANAGDVAEADCDHFHYDTRNEIWSRCHGHPYGGGPFSIHYPKQQTEDEMEVVTTLQIWRRSAGSAELTRICMTFTSGTTTCTGGSYDHYETVQCSDLNLPPSYRLHELKIFNNGRDEKLAISGLRLIYSDPEGAGGLQQYDCGQQKHGGWNSVEVDNNKGVYQLAGFYGRVGDWMDQLGPYLYDPPCKVISREIIDIQCKNPVAGRRRTDGECAGVFDPTKAYSVNVNSVCENCDSDAQDFQCVATFSTAQTHEITITEEHTDEIGGELSIGASFEFDIKLFGTGGGMSTESSVSVSYSHSWTESKSQTDSSTTTVQSTCTQTAAGGYISTMTADVLVGEMTADFEITYHITTQCGDQEEKVFDATALISNVASTEVIGKCEQKTEECTGGEVPFMCQLKINEAWQSKHSFESQSGFPLNMFASDQEGGYPYFDTVTGTWPNLASKEDFQKYFKCFGSFSTECDGLQFPNACHTLGLCSECFVIEDDICPWDSSTGGYCVGTTFGAAMEINAAKAACLVDAHCARIQCDNAEPWESACVMCSGDVALSTESSVTTTVYSPQSDCGNDSSMASRSAPGESGAIAMDPPTMQFTLPPPPVDCTTETNEWKCKNKLDHCEWGKLTFGVKSCFDPAKIDCTTVTNSHICNKRLPKCNWGKLTTTGSPTCYDPATVDCSTVTHSTTCNKKLVGHCLWGKLTFGTYSCYDPETVECSTVTHEWICKKRLNHCEWTAGACSTL